MSVKTKVGGIVGLAVAAGVIVAGTSTEADHGDEKRKVALIAENPYARGGYRWFVGGARGGADLHRSTWKEEFEVAPGTKVSVEVKRDDPDSTRLITCEIRYADGRRLDYEFSTTANKPAKCEAEA